MLSTPARSAGPSLVSTLALGWTASGRKRKSTGKRNTIIPGDNLADKQTMKQSKELI